MREPEGNSEPMRDCDSYWEGHVERKWLWLSMPTDVSSSSYVQPSDIALTLTKLTLQKCSQISINILRKFIIFVLGQISSDPSLYVA